MLEATQGDKGLITELLTKSFENNQSVNYIIRQDDKKMLRIQALMEYSFRMCHLFGYVWLSDDRKACALVLYPHKKKTTLETILLDIDLISRAIGFVGIGKVMKRETLIKKKQPKGEMAYLWFIGVDPMCQHSGIGSKLLQEVILDAEKKDIPIFLETSTLKNLPWYKRFGFYTYDTLELTYSLYFLKRIPAK